MAVRLDRCSRPSPGGRVFSAVLAKKKNGTKKLPKFVLLCFRPPYLAVQHDGQLIQKRFDIAFIFRIVLSNCATCSDLIV